MEDRIKAKKEDKVRDFVYSLDQEDTMALDINEELTFNDLLMGLLKGEDVYMMLGVSDSFIREKAFQSLADAFELSYDDVYRMWLVGGS